MSSNSDSIIAEVGWNNCPSKIFSFSSRHPVFPQEEFYRSRGEHRLQAKSKRGPYLLIAGKIAVPHPGSEGASSSLILRIAQEAQRRFSGSKVRFYLKKKFCGPEGTLTLSVLFSAKKVRKQGEQDIARTRGSVEYVLEYVSFSYHT